jgi:hypothetical protein
MTQPHGTRPREDRKCSYAVLTSAVRGGVSDDGTALRAAPEEPHCIGEGDTQRHIHAGTGNGKGLQPIIRERFSRPQDGFGATRILVKQGAQWIRTGQVPVYPDRPFGVLKKNRIWPMLS